MVRLNRSPNVLLKMPPSGWYALILAVVMSSFVARSAGSEETLPTLRPKTIVEEAIQWSGTNSVGFQMPEAFTAIALTQATPGDREGARLLLRKAATAARDGGQIYSNVVMPQSL